MTMMTALLNGRVHTGGVMPVTDGAVEADVRECTGRSGRSTTRHPRWFYPIGSFLAVHLFDLRGPSIDAQSEHALAVRLSPRPAKLRLRCIIRFIEMPQSFIAVTFGLPAVS